MKKLPIFAICIFLVVFICRSAGAYVLTFDDVPSGTDLRAATAYRWDYGVTFDPGFQASNHTGSVWGAPRSAPNVLIWAGWQRDYARLVFGRYTTESADPYWVGSVSGYFSTEMGTVLRLTAYDGNDPVGSVLIGASGASWSNRYVELRFGQTAFNRVDFESVSGPSGLYGFCADDMTVTPVPEPSSLLALLAALGGFGAMLRRRRG